MNAGLQDSIKPKKFSGHNVIPAGRVSALAKRAGRLAEKNRKKGYH